MLDLWAPSKILKITKAIALPILRFLAPSWNRTKSHIPVLLWKTNNLRPLPHSSKPCKCLIFGHPLKRPKILKITKAIALPILQISGTLRNQTKSHILALL